jgi:hypothetical protein
VFGQPSAFGTSAGGGMSQSTHVLLSSSIL